MIDRSEPHPITTVQSLPEWESILEEIDRAGYFGLNFVATGPDPLSHKIHRIILALPNAPSISSVYIADVADRPDLKESVIGELAGLMEKRRITKVLYDSKSVLSFIRAIVGRKLNSCRIFDLMLASQMCWSGYYYLTPSGNQKNPWKKRLVDHSLASLAERHLFEVFDLVGRMQDEAERKGFVTASYDGKRLCYYLNPDRQEDVLSFLAKRGYRPASTKAEVLRSLAATGYAFAEALMRYRHLTYNLLFLNKWLERIHPLDGRVHPQYFQIPESGRRGSYPR